MTLKYVHSNSIEEFGKPEMLYVYRYDIHILVTSPLCNVEVAVRAQTSISLVLAVYMPYRIRWKRIK